MKSKMHTGGVWSYSCCYLAVAHVKCIYFFQEARKCWKGSSSCKAMVLMPSLRGISVFLAFQPLGLVDYVEIRIYLAGVLGKEDF